MEDVSDNKYDYAADSQKPDVVVINLGTNDFGTEPYPDKKDFIEAYSGIVDAGAENVRKHSNYLCCSTRARSLF